MCGIVGIINYGKNYQIKAREIMMQLLLLDVVRGKDSTGIFKANEKKVDWRKAAVPSWEFFQLDGVDPFFNGLGNEPFIVGHNRWATRGKVKDDNAHPFEEGNITLVHNGTLTSMYQLPDHHKYDVDSQLIAHSIDKIGIEETCKKMNGAYALAYYDAKKKRLNLIRNDERPLWIVDIPKENMYLFGSEFGLLRWVAMRNGYEPGEPKMLEKHNLYSFEKEVKNPRVKKLEGYVSKYVGGEWFGGQHRGYLPVGGSGDDDYAGDSPIIMGHSPAAAPVVRVPEQRSVVVPFVKKPVAAGLMDLYAVGQVLLFSVNDYDDKIMQGGFVPITGDIPKLEDGKGHADFVVRGNFNASNLHALATTKNLLRGIITSINGLKHGRVLIQVKDVGITDMLDPFFMDGDQLKVWQGEQKPEEKKKDTSKECKQCYEIPADGNLYMVYKTGGPRNMCLKCLYDFNPRHALLPEGYKGTVN